MHLSTGARPQQLLVVPHRERGGDLNSYSRVHASEVLTATALTAARQIDMQIPITQSLPMTRCLLAL